MSDLAIKNRKLTLFLFVLLLLIAVVVWIRGTGQPYRGPERTLPGLGAEVTVRWDTWGVPHIAAESELDLVRVLGWLHANDRLVQMEIGRRAGRGLLSEAFGEDFFGADVFFRRLELETTAERMYENASDGSRQWLEAYTAGINAWLAERGRTLPPEIRLLNLDVEPWRPHDGLLFALLMSVDLSFWDDRPEEERFLWLRHFGADGLRELLGDPDVHIPQEIADLAAERWTPPEPAAPEDSGGEDSGGEDIALGSNNWAVAPSRSAGGGAMLANDPHLGLGLPPVWFQVQMRAPGFEAQGMTLPGTPGVVIGRGSHVAWAMTNVMLDDHDLFFEHLDTDGTHYLRDGAWQPIETEEVLVPIRGGEPRTLTLRRTDLGPLLDAEVETGLPARSLVWTAHLGGDPVATMAGVAKARNIDEALAVLEPYMAPAQNVVMAAADGEIARTILGHIPARRAGDGRLPSPGWDPAYGWDGVRDRATHPLVRAPEDGVIVTANHDIRPPGYELPLVAEFFPPFRADRIRQRLAARSDWTPEGFADVQVDHTSLFAQRVVPALVASLPKGTSEDADRALDALGGWDHVMAKQGPAALFVLAQKELLERIFGDEQAAAGLRKPLGHRATLLTLLESDGSERWWDDLSTAERETREDIVRDALAGAWRKGSAQWGDDVATWDYGWVHTLTLRHRLDAVPVLGWWLRRGPYELAGHSTTVLAFGSRWVDDLRQTVTYGPSMRWIVDWSAPDRAWSVLPGGQSGHPADVHYSDQIDDFVAGKVHEAPWSEEAIEAATVAETRFLP